MPHNDCHNSNINDKGLSISHLNVRSLRNKREELDDFIKRNSVDLFTISETWIDNSIHSNILDIAGYIFERKDRNIRGGGVGCYYKE